jgi:monoamine oxidase|tara:strand:+ start:547 stop:891 length:345 start_codon:yes stop_codon:yes gene_type:complete
MHPTLVFGRRSHVVPSIVTGDGFEAFWRVYPKRQAKKEAQKAWRRIRPDAATQAAILASLAWQVPTWTDLTYAPLPATYLRGERWTDEPVSVGESVDSRLPAWAQGAVKARNQR